MAGQSAQPGRAGAPPGVPVRQWVCSLPWRLRVLCGYDSGLCADVMKAFEQQVSRSLCRRAKKYLRLGSVKQAHTGSVLFIQRFDSALRLNVHGHLLSLDGVYVRAADGRLQFHELPEPSAKDVARRVRAVGPSAFTRRLSAASPGGNKAQSSGTKSVAPSALRTSPSRAPGLTSRVLVGIATRNTAVRSAAQGGSATPRKSRR